MMTPEFMMRVKLPDSGSYHSSPSGDSDYEEAYNKAIFDVLPPGFEVKYPRLGHKWAVDSEGYSLVTLICTDNTVSLNYYMKKSAEIEQRFQKLKEFLKNNGFV